MNNTLFYQLAQRCHARRIAELYRMSAEGYADYTWSLFAQPEESLLDVGEVRFSRENTEFSYQNCIITTQAHTVVGMLHSYPIYSLSEEGESSHPVVTDPVFMPFKELEEPYSLYVTGLAVDLPWRNRGVGSELLELALKRAHCYELRSLSLVCFSSNTAALRFYQNKGFTIIRERDVVAHPLISAQGKALLMKREL